MIPSFPICPAIDWRQRRIHLSFFFTLWVHIDLFQRCTLLGVLTKRSRVCNKTLLWQLPAVFRMDHLECTVSEQSTWLVCSQYLKRGSLTLGITSLYTMCSAMVVNRDKATPTHSITKSPEKCFIPICKVWIEKQRNSRVCVWNALQTTCKCSMNNLNVLVSRVETLWLSQNQLCKPACTSHSKHLHGGYFSLLMTNIDFNSALIRSLWIEHWGRTLLQCLS